MDSDQLQLVGPTISRSVLSQDITEYTARMSPKVILNVHYDKNGSHCGAPEVPARTLAGYLTAVQNVKDGGGPLYPPLPTVAKDATLAPLTTTKSTSHIPLPPALPNLPTSKSSTFASPPATSQGGAAAPSQDGYRPAQRFDTAHDAARHTLDIFVWLGKGRFIAEPKVLTSIRRPKKDTLLAAKGTSSPRGRSTAPAPLSIAPLEREFLSVVVVVYGRPGFLVQDECYLSEEGTICIIDRFLHTPPDQQDPSFIKNKISFFGLGKGKIDLINNKPPPLDFSFRGLREPLDILRVAPASGKVHVPKPVFKAPEEKRPLDRLQYAVSDLTKQTNRKLVVAKNRNGEEEAYEFEEKPVIRGEAEDNRHPDDEEMRGLVRKLENRYECEALRLCNNSLHTAHGLVRAMHNLVANYLLTVQWLDLSNNRLTDLPDLTMLPLRTLHLHANSISDWQVVEERIVPLQQLTSLTLFGNPIATTAVDYRDAALMRLLGSRPKGAPVMKTLDFAPISASDAQTSQMYSRFTKGGSIPLQSMMSTKGSMGPLTSPRSPRSQPGGSLPASPRRQ